MKILFLTTNIDFTRPLLEWLKQTEGADNVILYSEKIAADQFTEGNSFFNIEYIISYNYLHIIKSDVISLFTHRIINLHRGLLPWNKGVSPNIWSFIDGTPAGVTILEIDAGIDTGNILLQKEMVYDYKAETLKSSYEKSHIAITKLFCENWDRLKKGQIAPTPQKLHGTMHYKKELDTFKHIIDYDDTIEDFLNKYKKLFQEK